MSAELDELYQSIILDHNRRPRNFRVMEDASTHAEGKNPLCGDQLTIWLKLDGGVISDVSFQGSGCAISKASASLMTAAIKGKTRAEAEEMFTKFHGVVTGAHPEDAESLGSLKALGGVSRFPLRVKCASLAWHAMHAALLRNDEATSAAASVSTE
ncbi:MAG: SUF system NifU family Fe-S cluster assembly protein [Gemmatimonadetes bacterium]|nr:SUF system NifU family Fe-S cluster assembly protein [Gemmatimonadota bacterium]